jgi:hypothetical protein
MYAHAAQVLVATPSVERRKSASVIRAVPAIGKTR